MNGGTMLERTVLDINFETSRAALAVVVATWFFPL
jgi:hypothetical protein